MPFLAWKFQWDNFDDFHTLWKVVEESDYSTENCKWGSARTESFIGDFHENKLIRELRHLLDFNYKRKERNPDSDRNAFFFSWSENNCFELSLQVSFSMVRQKLRKILESAKAKMQFLDGYCQEPFFAKIQ